MIVDSLVLATPELHSRVQPLAIVLPFCDVPTVTELLPNLKSLKKARPRLWTMDGASEVLHMLVLEASRGVRIYRDWLAHL